MNAQVGFWLLHTHILWYAAVMNQGVARAWPGSQPEGYTHPDLCRAGCRRKGQELSGTMACHSAL